MIKISKSVFTGFLAAGLMASGGNVYAHSTNKNSNYGTTMMNQGQKNMPNSNEMMNNTENMRSRWGGGNNVPCDINHEGRTGFRMGGMMRYENGYGMGQGNYMGSNMGAMKGFMSNRFSGRKFIISRFKELNLTEIQIKAMRPVTTQMRKEKILFMGKMAALKSKIMAAKIGYPINFDKISSYIDERSKLINDFQKDQLNSLKKIYNDLTPGQKKTLAYY